MSLSGLNTINAPLIFISLTSFNHNSLCQCALCLFIISVCYFSLLYLVSVPVSWWVFLCVSCTEDTIYCLTYAWKEIIAWYDYIDILLSNTWLSGCSHEGPHTMRITPLDQFHSHIIHAVYCANQSQIGISSKGRCSKICIPNCELLPGWSFSSGLN